MAGFEGPVVPRRMTGALKLILGILAGGWKLEGKPPGRPGCWLLVCIPGGGAVPGAAKTCQRKLSNIQFAAYQFLVEHQAPAKRCLRGSHQSLGAGHSQAHLNHVSIWRVKGASNDASKGDCTLIVVHVEL